MKFSFSLNHSPAYLFSAIAVLAAGAAQAQTLNIVSGNGQIVPNASVASQPLTVQLLDATGRPYPNQLVSFLDNQSGQAGAVNGSAPPTDANGYTSVQFRGANIPQGNGVPYLQTIVIASFGTTTAVNFTETTAGVVAGGGGSLIQAIPQLVQGQLTSGPAGSLGTPIRVLVGSTYTTQGIPNVSVAISVDPGNTGTLSCKEGPVVYTDNTGAAVCTPVFGKIGTGTFTIVVGSQFTFSGYQFSVSVGPPGIIMVTSGDNQSGLPGQTLPLPVVAIVEDLAGDILPGIQVVFESVTPGGVTFTNSRTTSDANGRVSSSVVLGNIPGPVQIRIRDVGNLVTNPAILTATARISVSSLTKMGGDGQTTFINTPFGQPLRVNVGNASGQAVQSATVTFTVTSGSATVAPSTVLTDSGGNASATVTAGGIAGPVTVTASVTSSGQVLTQTFSLTVNPPGPTNFSYLNGASFAPNQISPGSIATIQAQGLVSANVQGIVGGTLVGALPYTVAGVSVTVDNIPAPIFYVGNQNGQQSVTIQVPFEVRSTTVPITVAVNGGGSTNAFVTVLPVSPGLFETVGADNRRRVVAIRPNGTVVTPQNPAGRGENVRVYLTGLGPVTPSVPTGTFTPFGSDAAVTSSLVAGIANNGVPIVQAIYARNLSGVYELTVTVPTDTVAFPSGTVNFSVAVQGPSGLVYSNPSSIVIQ